MRSLTLGWLLMGLAACGEQAPAPEPSAPGTPTPALEPATEAPTEPAAEPAPAPMPAWAPQLRELEPEAVPEALAEAEKAYEAGAIESGEFNALSIYFSVLQVDSENAGAQAGIERAFDQLLAQADAALAEGQLDEARRLQSVLRYLRPAAPELKALDGRIVGAQERARLLVQAAQLLEQDRLVAPAGDNAMERYREVLAGDPGNLAAQRGLAEIEARLLARAGAAAEAGDYAQADRLLADAARVRPGSPAVQDAGARIVERRQRHAAELLAQALAEVEAGRLPEAVALRAQLARVSVRANDIDALDERIELARHYGRFRPGQLFTDPLSSGGSGPELVVIPYGEFAMGAPEDEVGHKKSEGPRHTVRFERGFAMARNEITVGDYRRFVAATGHRGSAERAGRSSVYDEKTGNLSERRGTDWRDNHLGQRADDRLPVVHVSWTDAGAYAAWLSRETGERYRLPSEAEVEYVLRAGSDSPYPWGEGTPNVVIGNLTGQNDRSASKRAWTNAFANYGDGYWGPAPVRSYPANRFALFDLVGNVSEWTQDCWHDSYRRAPTDGSAWINPGCDRRVIRGASWASAPDQVRSAFRISAAPERTSARVGFRLVREL